MSTEESERQKLPEYEQSLRREERSVSTIAKYGRDLRAFFKFLNGRELTKEYLLEWKEKLVHSHAASSVNSMLAAVNGFLCWAGRPELRVRPVRIQKSIFCSRKKELTREDYFRLIQAAQHRKKYRLSLILQTICATGIRVSELRNITAEAVRAKRSSVDCKGKTRVILLPCALCRMLSGYCKEKGIKSGPIFRTKGGLPLDRCNIWKEMKGLCGSAAVDPEKVFPHNLRHLFAKIYYQMEKDLSRLADLLGHSNVSTTRIYTMESGSEHVRQLERMDLLFKKEKTT